MRRWSVDENGPHTPMYSTAPHTSGESPRSRHLTAMFSVGIVWAGRVFTWTFLASLSPFQPSTPDFPGSQHSASEPSISNQFSLSSLPIQNKQTTIPAPHPQQSPNTHPQPPSAGSRPQLTGKQLPIR
ncbi:hypothetical protein B0T18DRAFT_8918 [Schizothecium vesticola]|uniref:Uncharacterized protein n=1 Tax=Schizothecium vesticola TaxID=314040 RepID=A0AA40F8X3_9PEZI|nr:hypothetical protein B0T18DRAFT_8918 [Schizothecium vesticola]